MIRYLPLSLIHSVILNSYFPIQDPSLSLLSRFHSMDWQGPLGCYLSAAGKQPQQQKFQLQMLSIACPFGIGSLSCFLNTWQKNQRKKGKAKKVLLQTYKTLIISPVWHLPYFIAPYLFVSLCSSQWGWALLEDKQASLGHPFSQDPPWARKCTEYWGFGD